MGLNVTYASLPRIGRYYACGYNGSRYDTNENDVVTNSFVGLTVVPRVLPSSFNALGFLDTIKSYITEGRTLGWIANDPTKNKYTRLIDSAKANLSSSPARRGTAKAKLDSVLRNVHPDSAAALITSEAYALLRFNTEYVMKKLREEDSTFAVENKSSSWDATATNSARHLAKSEGHVSQVITSGGEIIYRRSDDEGASWNKTDQINTAAGENTMPCIAVTLNNSIQIVWQRKVGSSTYEVWHAYSPDNGDSWSTPSTLPGAGSVAVSAHQPEGPMPVIAYQEGMLVIVYCSSDGLRYRVSDDEGQSWQVPQPDIISGQADDEVRSPSLAGGTSYISLVYDYASGLESPWSRTFDGTSWSDERSLGKGTDISDAELSCVAIDAEENPIAVWTGVGSSMTYGKVIGFRAGYSDNTWSEWFTVFGQNFVDHLAPSVTYYDRDGGYGLAIVNHTSQNHVKLITLANLDPPSWDVSTLSESGAWATITQEMFGGPLLCWTDQSEYPYAIVAPSGLTKAARRMRPQATQSMRQSRRAVLQYREPQSCLSLEFEQMKIVLANGDTTRVPFKQSPLRQRGKITPSNMWEYLGSDGIRIPPTARTLVVSKQFGGRGTPPGTRQFVLRLLNAAGHELAVLDTTAHSGTIAVSITQYAGTEVVIRPSLDVSGPRSGSVSIGVGDVFIAPSEQ